MSWRREMTLVEVPVDSVADVTSASPQVRSSPLCQTFLQTVRACCGRRERTEPYATGQDMAVVVRKSFIELDDCCRSAERVTRSAPGTPLSIFPRVRGSPMAAMLLRVGEGLASFAAFTDEVPATPTSTCHRAKDSPLSEKLFSVNEGEEAFVEAGETGDKPHCPESLDRWSIGSQAHAAGTCKPCGFFWSARGCQNGRDCQHCHLCDESVRKIRKKDCASTRKRRSRRSHGCASMAVAPLLRSS